MRILKTYVLPISFVGLLLFVDQITKWLAVRHLAPLDAHLPPRDVVLIDGFLRLTFLENNGMAFGLMEGARWLFIPLTIVMIGVMIYIYKTAPEGRMGKLHRITILVLIGGALGNFVDRLFREGGFVIDFIIFEFFPFVFNLADVFVVVSVFALIILMAFTKEKKNVKTS